MRKVVSYEEPEARSLTLTVIAGNVLPVDKVEGCLEASFLVNQDIPSFRIERKSNVTEV